MCRTFIWKGKHPRISFSTLLWRKTSGGLSLPNFKSYFCSFQIKAINTRLDASSVTPWRSSENTLSSPVRIQDLPFSNIKQKMGESRMGPIISNIGKHISFDCKYHKLSPIWYNNALLSGCTPFLFLSGLNKAFMCKGMFLTIRVFTPSKIWRKIILCQALLGFSTLNSAQHSKHMECLVHLYPNNLWLL